MRIDLRGGMFQHLPNGNRMSIPAVVETSANPYREKIDNDSQSGNFLLRKSYGMVLEA
jgi:hypothetical protein